MAMKNPVHPGEIVREECIRPLGLTVEQAARGRGVNRSTLSRLINGRAGVSPEMAVRLSKGFGSTPETWLRMQMNYNLSQMRRKLGRIKVDKLEPA